MRISCTNRRKHDNFRSGFLKNTNIQRLHGLQQEISMLDVKIENSITGAERVGKSQMQTKKEIWKISPESLRKMDDLLTQIIKNLRETKKQIIQALEDVAKILDQQYAKLGTFLNTYIKEHDSSNHYYHYRSLPL
jgi:hypothetical protein